MPKSIVNGCLIGNEIKAGENKEWLVTSVIQTVTTANQPSRNLECFCKLQIIKPVQIPHYKWLITIK